MANNSKIMVVDDSSANRLLLCAVLEEFGFQVLEAENGEQAVELALENACQLILMDMNMPVMSGMEATQILRGIHFDAPIIACSAEEDVKQIGHILTCGFSDFICKPIQPEQLRTLLEKHLLFANTQSKKETPAYENKLVELNQKFRHELPELIKELEYLLAQGKTQDLKNLAHKLRGTASQLGFKQVSERSKTIEQAIKAHDFKAAIAATQVLLDELSELKSIHCQN